MSDRRRIWERLQERLDLGDELTADELELCSLHETEDAQDELERREWDGMIEGLRDRAAASDDLSRARAVRLGNAVLERHRRAGESKPAAARARRRRWAAGVAAVAAMAAGLAWIAISGDRTSPPANDANAITRLPGIELPARSSVTAVDTALPATTTSETANARAVSGELALIEGDAAKREGSPVVGSSPEDASTLAYELGRHCLNFEQPAAAICLDEGSLITVAGGSAPGTRIVALERGRMVVSLETLAAGQRFEITTTAGTVAAVGTIFEVEVGDAGVRATVSEGAVSIRDGAGERKLHVGQSSVLCPEVGRCSADPRGGAEAAGAEAIARGLAVGRLAQLWRADELGTIVVTEKGARTGAQVSIDGIGVGPAPVSLLAAVGRHHVAVAGAFAEQTHEIDVRRDSVASIDVDLPGDRERETGSRPSSADELWQRAQLARKAGDYAEAAALYQRLLDEHPGDPRTRNVGVRLGDLLVESEPRRALRAYERYLEQAGELAPEAEYGRIRALRRLGERVEERRAIEAFVASHADDPRASSLAQRLLEL